MVDNLVLDFKDFKREKNNDDFYTPKAIMDIIIEFCKKEFKLNDDVEIIRLFNNETNFLSLDYENKIVIDNPPFSILSQILEFYNKNNIKYFLFANAKSGIKSYYKKTNAIYFCGHKIYFNFHGKNIMKDIAVMFLTNLVPKCKSGAKLVFSKELYDKINSYYKIYNFKKQKIYNYPSGLYEVLYLSRLIKYSDKSFVIDEYEDIEYLYSKKECKKVRLYLGRLKLNEKDIIFIEKLRDKLENSKKEKVDCLEFI